MVDLWEESIYKHYSTPNLPKGWEMLKGVDGQTIYRDEDYNEYIKDEYGHFISLD